MRLAEACPNSNVLSIFYNLNNGGWFINGTLPLKAHGENGSTRSIVSIQVKENWIDVPPVVTAYGDYIRCEQNWHASSGSLCYVLAQEWQDRLRRLLAKSDGDMNLVMDFATTWLLAATDSLITRHFFASRCGIVDWPADWPEYAHGNSGVEEYKRDGRKG